jgi:hypothetical protein
MRNGSLSAEKLTDVYLKIKEKRSELSAEFRKKDSDLNEQLEIVKKALLDYCEEQGLESVRTEAGLFYRSVKTRYWTSDWPSMYEFILDNNVLEFFDRE